MNNIKYYLFLLFLGFVAFKPANANIYTFDLVGGAVTTTAGFNGLGELVLRGTSTLVTVAGASAFPEIQLVFGDVVSGVINLSEPITVPMGRAGGVVLSLGGGISGSNRFFWVIRAFQPRN